MKKTAFVVLLVLLALFIAIPAALGAQDEAVIELQYDDRISLSDLLGASADSVIISDQTISSFVTGTGTKDSTVLVYQDGTLYAVGTGTAILNVDGIRYTVRVSPAPLSIIMITGHSIGAGQEGNAAQSVVCEAGQAYSTTKGQLTSSAGGLRLRRPHQSSISARRLCARRWRHGRYRQRSCVAMESADRRKGLGFESCHIRFLSERMAARCGGS